MYTHLFHYETPALYVGYKRDEPGTFLPLDMHVHSYYELNYFVSCKGYYDIEGVRYPVFPGCILLIRPNEAHMPRIDTNVCYDRLTYNFSPRILEELDPDGLLKNFMDNLPSPQILLPAEYDLFFKQLFQSLPGLNGASPDAQRSFSLSILTVALLELRSIYNTSPDTSLAPGNSISDVIRDVLLYMNDHLTEELSLDDLCRRFGLSKSYLNRCFKEITGATPWNYILVKRLSLARQYIQNGIPVQAAYRSCGFHDYSAFYRSYIKRFGVAPTEDVN
ncbi:MAG: helix-turn-helix domain-containing protein [Firmicutes bacterium]|nr:helix-turn-helix domain-containing protein [Bacillota bacterium]